MNRIHFALLAFCLSATGVGQVKPTADFYVATNGNDAWTGKLAAPNPARTDGPFASVARAQQAVRGLRGSKPLTVMLRGGTYYLPLSPTSPGTLRFDATDSGAPQSPIAWANYPGET